MTLIANLRSRPAFERRILGVCAYAAIAAVIIALWVVSFRDNIARITEISGQRQASPDTPTLPSLPSPFETISQTSRQVRERFAEALAGAERIGRGGEEPKTANLESQNAALPEALSSEAEITVRYATGGDTAARGAPADLSAQGLPKAQAPGESGAAAGSPAGAPPANLAAKPESIAPMVAGRLAMADLPGERPQTVKDPLARPSNRLGFFSALASVLSAVVRSFAGLAH